MNFMIVRSLSPYNGIIGRPGIREIQAVPSTAHGMLKFPVDGGIVTIRSTILIPAECATVITSSKEIPKEAGRKGPCRYLTLKKCIKKSDFHWTPEAEQAFKKLKQHLSELPLLVAPKPKEELIVFLSATHGAISAVLMTERGTVQTLVYFVSRTLQGPELNYTPQEKLVLSLVFAVKRLWMYFQAHPIVVVTDQPIKQSISRLDVAGRLQKWSVMLGEHNITYWAKTSVKDDPVWTNLAKYGGKLIVALDSSAAWVSRIVAVIPKPWLRCVGPLQADYVIREIHEGSCSMHARPRSVVAKAMRLGYYLPTMHRDARDMIRASGPFLKGPRKVKFLIVAMDYFMKWIEAKAVATITGNQVKKFVWDNIVCRFSLPGEIISDNGKQFSDNPFKDWCEKLNITQRFASVKHPQSNGLVERANQSLGEGIRHRMRLGKRIR
ncbi:reverse transcriptase domain-containing protein [Tanacetum coccineum]|uniref:Reverse transcriptase domain-containing protein n=1 Tax=Tanacetum coccineum TaxID=301880 RepID=A0ABQ4XAJ0_9ASTR